MKKNFSGQKNGCKTEQEGTENDGDMGHRHGEEAQKGSQSKERQKLSWDENLSFQTKKNFQRQKNGCKSEQEGTKNDGDMGHRHGEEAQEVYQSKERPKLGWGQNLSFGTKKMATLMKMMLTEMKD